MTCSSDDGETFIYIPHQQPQPGQPDNVELLSIHHRPTIAKPERALEASSRDQEAASSRKPRQLAVLELDVVPQTHSRGRIQDQQHVTSYRPSTAMAIFHICRICQRPRSDRYHREHPIAPGTIPPPSGICRRCRVMCPEQEVKRARIVRVGESNPIKIGLSGIMPDSAVVSRKQMEEEMYEKIHSRRSHSSKSSSGKEIVYRYVKPSEALVNRARASILSTDNIEALNEQNKLELQILPAKSQSLTQLRQKRELASADDTSKGAVQKPTAPAPVSYTESAIRRIARDEVERYRRAERNIDTHPEPYAHGRMVVADVVHEPAPLTVGKSQSQKTTPAETEVKKDSARYPYLSKNDYSIKPATAVSLDKCKSESGQSRKARLGAVYEPAPGSKSSQNHQAWSTITQQETVKAQPQESTRCNERQAKPRTGQDPPRASVYRNGGREGRGSQDSIRDIDKSLLTPKETTKLEKGSSAAPESGKLQRKDKPGATDHSSTYYQLDDDNAPSDWTDREYWEDDRTIKTASRYSSSRQQQEYRSDSASKAARARSHNLQRQKAGYDRPQTVSDEHKKGERHRRSDTDKEWEYRLHTVQPADQDAIVEDFDPQRRRVTKIIQHHRRSDHSSEKIENEREAATRRTAGAESDIQRASQVRFATTVDISPTPPASEDFSASADKFEDQRRSRRAERQCENRPRQGLCRVGRDGHDAAAPADEVDRTKCRPRSESPAREIHRLGRKDGRAPREESSRRAEPREHRPRLEQDPYGPYRLEVPSDSMMALTGSARSSAAPRASYHEV